MAARDDHTAVLQVVRDPRKTKRAQLLLAGVPVTGSSVTFKDRKSVLRIFDIEADPRISNFSASTLLQTFHRVDWDVAVAGKPFNRSGLIRLAGKGGQQKPFFSSKFTQIFPIGGSHIRTSLTELR